MKWDEMSDWFEKNSLEQAGASIANCLLDILMRIKARMEDIQYFRSYCLGVDRHGNFGISGPRLDNWALICPPCSKIVQSKEKTHGTSYQRAIVHVFRCCWR